jgi:cation:H+ antiporter
LLLLIAGADLLVRAAVALAARWGVRPLIVGLTVMAFGSSLPQLVIGVQAAWSGAPDIAVGSVIGSNTFSLLATLGCSALIIPLRVSRPLVRLDIPLMLGASLLLWLLALNQQLGRLEGCLLLAGLGLYLWLVRRQARRSARPLGIPRASRRPWGMSLGLMLAGLALLAGGAHLVLGAAIAVALDYGLSDRIIGLTIVAVGSSMPGLATSLIAAWRGHRELAVGNVVGGNLCNLLGVLGLTALIAPQPLSVSPNALAFDLPVMVAVAALCLPLFYSSYRVSRGEGLMLLALYLAYALHVLAFATGLPLADDIGALMRWVLPVLAIAVLARALRAWRRQRNVP